MDELETRFVENYHSDIELHAEYIREQLDKLSKPRDPGSAG